MSSISTLAPFGKAATWTVLRDGAPSAIEQSEEREDSAVHCPIWG
jgi:hypothetical protein